MGWVALIASGIVVWAACAGEMPEAVRLAVAPVIAAAATLFDKLISPDFDSLTRAVGLMLIVGVLDALVLAPLLDRRQAIFRSALGSWLPWAAIFVASYVTGTFGPM